MRLDLALISKHPGLSRRKAQAAIEKGQVLVEGVVCQETGHAVTEATRVEWDKDRRALPRPHRVPSPYPVLYQDEHVLIVDKPAGVLAVPAPGDGDEKSVLGKILEAAGPRVPHRRTFVGRVHRLDRDTSGALAFALSPEARAGLIALFRDHRIERRYLALVEGEPLSNEGQIEAPIALAYVSGRRRLARGDEPQSPAFTRYKVRERLGGAALLEVEILTGRQHQIRLHLAHVGLPVIGDRVYRPREAKTPPPVAARRQMLHAETLGFAHPLTGAPVRATSPVPEDMRLALTKLRRRPRTKPNAASRTLPPVAPRYPSPAMPRSRVQATSRHAAEGAIRSRPRTAPPATDGASSPPAGSRGSHGTVHPGRKRARSFGRRDGRKGHRPR